MPRRATIVAPLLALALAPVPALAQRRRAPSVPPPAPSATAPRLTRPPRLVTFVEATYPEGERAQGRAASVTLQLNLTAQGTVGDATVIASAGEAFDRAALDAARRFVFEPAEIDGQPAAVRITYRYDFVLRPEPPATTTFEGLVRDGAGGAGLAGVAVAVEGAGQAVTDAAGRFRIAGVPPGSHTVTLTASGLAPVQTTESFEAGHDLRATYDLGSASTPGGGQPAAAGDDLEIVVSAPPLRREVVSTAVSADQARRVPGAQGDVLRVVESMPGVARASAGSGQLIVWGAGPQDTRTYVDGVPVPRLYHDGGLRSVVHSDLVEGVELIPGGYGAAFGRGLGGMVGVTTRGPDNGLHGSAAVDLIDAAVSARAPLGQGVRVAVAARRSHLDSVLSAASRDLGSYFPLPHYYDAQARLTFLLGPRETVDVTALVSSDSTTRAVPDPDPARATSETRSLLFYRLYARYRVQLDDGAEVTVVPFVGYDDSSLESTYGPVATGVVRRTIPAGVRAAWRGRPLPWLAAQVGLDAEVDSSTLRRSGTLALPAREGDVHVFGQPPPDQINADRWSTTSVGLAPYLELDAAFFGGALHVVPGLRLDAYARSVSRRAPPVGSTPEIGLFTQDFRAEPRLAVRWAPGARASFQAAYGVYHQAPEPEDLSATFGNPALPLATAQHVLAGGSVRLTDTLSAEATGFVTYAEGLAVRNPNPAPQLAQALLGTGLGRTYGGQFLVRQLPWRGLFGWVSYTVSRSERSAGPGQPWRLSDYDQTHVLTAVAGYTIGLGVEVGLRFRIATGFPRTEVTGAYYDAARDRYEPLFGAQNGTRIPTFVQVDLRISKRFHVGPGEIEASLDVQNATNQSNPEEIVYSQDFSQRGYITGLPILPVLGLRGSL